MIYLKIAIHNEINQPVYLEVPVPDDLAAAIRFSKITRAEFLLFEKGHSGRIVQPAFSGKTELAKARWG